MKTHIRFSGAKQTLCGKTPQVGWLRMLSWGDLQKLAIEDRCKGCATRAERRNLP